MQADVDHPMIDDSLPVAYDCTASLGGLPVPVRKQDHTLVLDRTFV
jgi:hypothetical protein